MEIMIKTTEYHSAKAVIDRKVCSCPFCVYGTLDKMSRSGRRAYEVFTAQAVCSTIAELQLQKSRRKTMQEEVTQKTIALVFKSSRLTADVLKKP